MVHEGRALIRQVWKEEADTLGTPNTWSLRGVCISLTGGGVGFIRYACNM